MNSQADNKPSEVPNQDALQAPHDPVVFIDKGWSHLGRGEFDEAIGAFEKALSMDRQSLDAQYGIGAAANARGDKDRAKKAFEQVLEMAKTSSDMAKVQVMSELARWALKNKV